MVMDQTTDPNGQTLHRLTRLYEPPEFVKVATQEQISGKGLDLPPESFGDPRTRQFPTHSPAATVASAMYLLEAEPHLGKTAAVIRERIDRSAEYFGVAGAVKSLRDKHAAQRPSSVDDLADGDFAYVALYENGAKERALPLRNPSEVKAATDWLRQWRNEFEYEDRRTIAERILRKAASVSGIDADDEQWLYKQAGFACGSGEKAAEALFKRAQSLRILRQGLEDQEQLTKVALQLSENPGMAHDPKTMQKVAGIIDAADRQYRLVGLGDPEDLFEFTVKEAQDYLDDTVEMINGTTYKKADLARIDLAGVRDLLGNQFADQVSTAGLFLDTEKLAEQMRILPRNDANLFDRLAEAVSITPIEKLASAPTPVENDVFGAALAALHNA